MSEIKEYYDREIENRTRTAISALEGLIVDASATLDRLRRNGSVLPGIGGGVLNHQCWPDAERALVRLWAAQEARNLLAYEGGGRS